jgi:hypothetical protein
MRTKRTKELFFVCTVFVILIGFNAYAQDRIIARDTFGCVAHSYLYEFISISNSGDKQAALRYMTSRVLLGECEIYKAGTPVYLESTRLRSGMVQVRKKGETRKDYVTMESVQ